MPDAREFLAVSLLAIAAMLGGSGFFILLLCLQHLVAPPAVTVAALSLILVASVIHRLTAAFVSSRR